MSLRQWICNTLNCSEECEERNNSLTTSINQCSKGIQDCLNKLSDSQEALKEASKLYSDGITKYNELKQSYDNLAEGYPPEDPEERFWNNKYPKKDIVYTGRWITVNGAKKELNIDVRNYFTPYDHRIPTVSGATKDEKALNALKWVVANIKYVSDKPTYGEWEYWLFPFETLKTRKGDCEDGAILLANIMICSGIPYWRIRLNAGDVKGGGHAYVTYCRETDNEFVVLDWCYWINLGKIKDRKLHSEERNYYGIWFSWNQKYSFAKNDYIRTAMKTIPVKVKKWQNPKKQQAKERLK